MRNFGARQDVFKPARLLEHPTVSLDDGSLAELIGPKKLADLGLQPRKIERREPCT